MKYWRRPLDRDRIEIKHYCIDVLKEQCKGCGWCTEFCPRGVIHESPEFNGKGYHIVYADEDNECVDCGLCVLICPEFALRVVPIKKEVQSG
jgi:2-oxoglutarate ferredoxin oxidoreductase subunit delta